MSKNVDEMIASWLIKDSFNDKIIMWGESMPNMKKQFKEICKEYGVVGASLEIYKNNQSVISLIKSQRKKIRD